MKFESNQGSSTPEFNSTAESLSDYCSGSQGSRCRFDSMPKSCAEMAAEMNGETPIREIGTCEDDCIAENNECDFEDIEEMILEIDRMQARERGQGPRETLPEMEYIIANEWGD